MKLSKSKANAMNKNMKTGPAMLSIGGIVIGLFASIWFGIAVVIMGVAWHFVDQGNSK